VLKHLTERREWSERNALQKGFTLIELLVVIVILGILAAVVVFAVQGIGDKGQGSACSIDRRTIKTAQEAAFAKNGAYTTEAGLVAGGFLEAVSTYYDVTLTSPTAYTVTPQAGSPCT
jgi:general secretion pathway protein G